MQKCKFAGVSDPESCMRNTRLVGVSVVCGRCNICQPMICGAWQYLLAVSWFACRFLTVHMLDVA
jgi:hypothetical protein